MEYEAVDDGVMAKIVVPEGTNDVPVNQLIAVMAQEGEDVKAAAAGGEGRANSTRRRSPLIPTFSPSGRRRGPASRRAIDNRSSSTTGEGSTAAGAAARSLSRSGERVGVRAFGPTVMAPAPAAPTASFLRRWRGGSPRTPASTSAASKAPARTAASSPATSRRRNRAKACARRPPRLRPRRRSAHRAVDVGPADPRAVRRRQLRFRAARRHAPHHRAAADRLSADHSALLPDHRLRHRQASRGARGDQRRPRRRTRTASRPTSFRSTTSSSRRWRSRCSACPTPM